jgi:hypothetical protein
MFGLRSRLEKSGTLVVEMPPTARIANGLVAAVVVAAMVVSGGPSLPGIALAAVATALALYVERFEADPAGKEFRTMVGFFPFAARASSPFASAQAIRIETFRKGSQETGAALRERVAAMEASNRMGERVGLRKVTLKLRLDLIDGSSIVVDSAPYSERGRIERLAEALAEASGLDIVEE